MRSAKLSLAILAAAAAGLSAPAFANGVTVPIDQARVVTFKQPVATVYIGNPSMADINVIDSKRAFVLGKTFGTTNIIALDKSGKVLVDEPLTVLGDRGRTVTLNRGPEQFTYACANTRCEAAPVPGDNMQAWYGPVTGESSQREGLGEKQAAAASSQQ